jgi:hypothetical protein
LAKLPEATCQAMLVRQPIGRLARPEEIDGIRIRFVYSAGFSFAKVVLRFFRKIV